MKAWQLCEFEKEGRPLCVPDGGLRFSCPVSEKEVRWQASNVYNPACIVRDGKLYFTYRADGEHLGGVDPFGNAKVTCRIGLAVSTDGIHFEHFPAPVLYPDKDDCLAFEWWGGCGDMHVIEGEDGRYYMNYDGWTGYYNTNAYGMGASPDEPWEDVLLSSVSEDMIHWKKCGPALKPEWKRYYNHSRTGVVISREKDGKLIAEKIGGKYYMYMSHKGTLASSDDLLHWDLVLRPDGSLTELFSAEEKREGFDYGSHEAGAAAILTEHGIVYFYNAMGEIGGKTVWSQGQALISKDDLVTVLDKAEEPLFAPEYEWECVGHSGNPAVVCNSLVKWQGKWMMYYGAADHVISRAVEVQKGT